MARNFRSLIRYHQWQVDEERRALGQLLGEVNELENQAAQLERDLITEQSIASANPVEDGFTYGDYARAAINRRHELAAAIDETEVHISAAQETTREAYLDLKSIELVQEARDKAEETERLSQEQATLDELGLEKFHRRAQ